jgi:hypothetical protein
MVSLLTLLALTVPSAEPPPLIQNLIEVGLAIPEVGRHKMPKPTLEVGMPEAQVKAVVKTFEDDRPDFLEPRLSAPYRLDRMTPLENKDGDTRGRELNLWFAAHGDIKKLDDQNILGTLLGAQGKKKAAKDTIYLEEADLKKRGITPVKIANGDERFSVLEMDLIEKVRLSGVLRTQRRWINGSLVSTMILDERFANDAKYPNRWAPIDPEDHDKTGPAKPYSGFAGYIKATPVPGMKDVIFVEVHFAFSEPFDWFEGKNLLASKMPLAVKQNVPALRRKIAGKN